MPRRRDVYTNCRTWRNDETRVRTIELPGGRRYSVHEDVLAAMLIDALDQLDGAVYKEGAEERVALLSRLCTREELEQAEKMRRLAREIKLGQEAT